MRILYDLRSRQHLFIAQGYYEKAGAVVLVVLAVVSCRRCSRVAAWRAAYRFLTVGLLHRDCKGAVTKSA
jgi:hypothetical protein